LITVGRLCVR